LEISGACFLQECERSFPKVSEIRQHGLLFAEKPGIEGDRRFAANKPSLDHQKRKMEFLKQWDRPGDVANDAIGTSQNGALDLAEVSDDFGGGPSIFARAHLPLLGRNLVGSSQERLLGEVELFRDTRQIGQGVWLSMPKIESSHKNGGRLKAA
jgi:hypothetical protein